MFVFYGHGVSMERLLVSLGGGVAQCGIWASKTINYNALRGFLAGMELSEHRGYGYFMVFLAPCVPFWDIDGVSSSRSSHSQVVLLSLPTTLRCCDITQSGFDVQRISPPRGAVALSRGSSEANTPGFEAPLQPS